MAKITPSKRNERETITVKTKPDSQSMGNKSYKWWKAKNKTELTNQVLATVYYLKEQQANRYRQAAVHARLYGNMPLFNFAGSSVNKMSGTANLPIDRPTMNVVQSCVDTLTSRVTQSRPRPVFLTEGGDYKKRTLAKSLNNFISGEFYQTKAYEKGEYLLRDGEVFGTGALKVVETLDHKVGVERRLWTELLVDDNDGRDGNPRQLFELNLVDREVLAEYFPQYRSDIAKAEQGFPDTSAESNRTISDQVMVAEAWRLPSGKDTGDGRHVMVCSTGCLLDEEFTKDRFPFVFLPYCKRLVGFWGQGIPERLMGTQMEINKLLQTISQSINLVGVPRVFVEDGSKVVKAHLTNNVGAIVTYQGTKPSYEVAPCVPQELYAQLQRLVDYAYQQEGVSALAASSKKPEGLNSGVAMREFDDIQSDRFATLQKRYSDAYQDLAYLIIDKAMDIAKEQGSYQTVYPGKNGSTKIDLPNVDKLKDPFIIQCFDSSSLPRDPAGRLQKVTEMMQSGLIDPQEGRRLLDFPDIEQVDKLANAAEEKILKILDEIIEDGKYTPPDPFMDLGLALKLVQQYYNLYTACGLEEKKQQMLRDFFSQIQAIQQAAMPPAPMGGASPQAVPQSQPVSDLMSNVPQPQQGVA